MEVVKRKTRHFHEYGACVYTQRKLKKKKKEWNIVKITSVSNKKKKLYRKRGQSPANTKRPQERERGGNFKKGKKKHSE